MLDHAVIPTTMHDAVAVGLFVEKVVCAPVEHLRRPFQAQKGWKWACICRIHPLVPYSNCTRKHNPILSLTRNAKLVVYKPIAVTVN